MGFLSSSAMSTPPQLSPVSAEQPAVSKTGGTRIDALNEAQLRSVLACLQPHLGPDQDASGGAQAFPPSRRCGPSSRVTRSRA
jgi:hypothetical protein